MTETVLPPSNGFLTFSESLWHRAAPLLLALALAGALLGGLLVGYEPVGGDPDRLYRPLKSELARSLAAGESAVLERAIRAGRSARGREPCRCVLSSQPCAVPAFRRLDGVSPVDVAALRGARRHDLRLRPMPRAFYVGQCTGGSGLYSLRLSGDPFEP